MFKTPVDVQFGCRVLGWWACVVYCMDHVHMICHVAYQVVSFLNSTEAYLYSVLAYSFHTQVGILQVLTSATYPNML